MNNQIIILHWLIFSDEAMDCLDNSDIKKIRKKGFLRLYQPFLFEEKFGECRPEGCGEVGVQDGVDTGVGVGQHVGTYLE